MNILKVSNNQKYSVILLIVEKYKIKYKYIHNIYLKYICTPLFIIEFILSVEYWKTLFSITKSIPQLDQNIYSLIKNIK